MRAVKPLIANLSLGLAAALAVAGCARSIDMSVASLHQKTPEFDFLLYQDGWACLSKGTPGRDTTGSCPPTSGRQLRELFAQRSSALSLRDYLIENGASCRSDNNVTTCNYTKSLTGTPLAPGPQAGASREEGLELTVSFPAKDLGLAPEQIRTALRRFPRVL